MALRGARREGDKKSCNLIKAITDGTGNICGATTSILTAEQLSLLWYLSLSANYCQNLEDLLRLNT